MAPVSDKALGFHLPSAFTTLFHAYSFAFHNMSHRTQVHHLLSDAFSPCTD
jgi:hypothetical protein